jgi:endonuclease III
VKSSGHSAETSKDVMLALPEILERLKAFYGPLPGPPHDPFAMYVWEVMNFHSVPGKREAALAALRRIPALTPDSIWKAPAGKLEAAANLAGPYMDERVRALRAGADVFRRHPDLPRRVAGSVLQGRRALRVLPQLGESGTHRMLLYAGGHPILPVDSHLARVALRLGLAAAHAKVRQQVRAVRRALGAALPPDLEARRRAVLILEHHGQATCAEFDPHCHICPLRTDCATGRERELTRATA